MSVRVGLTNPLPGDHLLVSGHVRGIYSVSAVDDSVVCHVQGCVFLNVPAIGVTPWYRIEVPVHSRRLGKICYPMSVQ